MCGIEDDSGGDFMSADPNTSEMARPREPFTVKKEE